MQIKQEKQHWVDATEYPFTSRYFQTAHGSIHYVDEGQGEAIVFVHGTPTWSFLYRNYIKELSKSYRCIAMDHLGFGLSDKPKHFAGTPAMHSHNMTLLLRELNLSHFTLVVHDFGGPIGLAHAIANPHNVSRVVLFNTWLWSTGDDRAAQRIDRILHSRLGNFLYLSTNLSPKILLKQAFYNKQALSKKIHTQYTRPFPNKDARHGLLNIGKSLIGASDWFEEQWQQIDRIKDKPFLILWGENDRFITMDNLQKWQRVLTDRIVHPFRGGHFVQEENFNESLVLLKNWLMKYE